jgi:imidazolonepropionase-like amidohydrolase
VVRRAAIVLAALAAAGLSRAATAQAAADDAAPRRYALTCGKVFTLDGTDRVLRPGLILIEDGRIDYVGPPREVPDGWTRLDYPDGWAAPGLVDLHTHIHGVGWGDTNDMVLPTNPELRAAPAFVPSNDAIRRACAGGVTTLFAIPGSGTSISGFGLVYKAKTRATWEECVLRDPGGMKVAQTHNPERGAGDLGRTWAGLSWLLEHENDAALAASARGEPNLRLANLERVHRGELPVLIHCAGIEGVASTARMWKQRYGTQAVLSHGSFDGHRAAEWVASLGMPVNHGPRTMDFTSTRTGAIVGTAQRYVEAGVPLFSLNTDSGVIPQEELFLQGSMSARLGADGYLMLKAVTIHPARAFGLADRVGSLENGKDADVVVWDGVPLDPRSRVEVVLIDGDIQYERARDGQWF